jgi:tetratricopeptide (TPR) repeat protein
VLSQSRTAIASLLVAALVLARPSSRTVAWVFALLAVTIVAIPLLFGFGDMQPITNLIEALPGSHTWRGRPEIWGNALRALSDFFLTGVGLNSFVAASRARYTYLIASPSWDFVHAHNVLLQVGLDYGLAGLVAFVGVAVAAVEAGLRVLNTQGARKAHLLAAGLLGSLCAYLAFGTIDAVVLGAKPSLLFWLATGGLAQLSTRAVRRPRWAKRQARTLGIALIAAGLAVVLGHRPLLSRALSDWGQLAVNHGLESQAGSILERAVGLDPGNRSAWRGLVDARTRIGDIQDAAEAVQHTGLKATDLAERGESLRRLGQIDRAERYQQLAMALDPGLSDVWYYMGLVDRDKERIPDAYQAFETALALDDFCGVADRQDVLDQYRRPYAWVFVDLGRSLMQSGETEQAIAILGTIVENDPTYVPAMVALGQSYLRNGDAEEAAQVLQVAHELDASNYWGHAILSSALARLGEWERALQMQMIALQVADGPEQRTRSIDQIIQLLPHLGESVDACSQAEAIWRRLGKGTDFDRIAPEIGCAN